MTVRPPTQELTPAGKRILDVASTLFYQRGIHAVGVDLIAREAGVTKKTIYDRFGSKDALVQRYLQTRDDFWQELIDEYVLRPEHGPRARMLAMFDILDHHMRERGCAFVNAHAELSEDQPESFAMVRRSKTWLREFFRNDAEEAGVENSEALAAKLLMLQEGSTIAYAMAGEENAARLAREAAETLIDAALASSSP